MSQTQAVVLRAPGLALGRRLFGLLGAALLASPSAYAQTASPLPIAPAAEPAAPVPPVAPAGTAVPAPATPTVIAPVPATPTALPPAPANPAIVPAASGATNAPATRLATSPGEALVHVAVNYRDAWLETRSYVDGGAFARTCRAPCDVTMLVEGREARVVAPGMTTSNIFRFDAGGGVAGVRVDGGSAAARRAGIVTLAIGIPVALAGMGLFAMGHVKHNTGLQAAGIAGLAGGGVSIAISLPLLLIGSTHVKNAKGSHIASLLAASPAL